MRQVRPRSTHPALSPQPDTTRVLLDLRDEQHVEDSQQLQAQLLQARQAVREVTRQLAILIDERDALRRRLEGTAPVPPEPGDQSIVPWGFFDDELG